MINWLIEEFSRDNSFLEIKDEALKRGHNVKVVESIPFFYDPHWQLFPPESSTVFLGSIQCAKQIQRNYQRHKWNPAVWITWDNYKCSTFMSYWGEFALNREYQLIPLADFMRRHKDIMKQSMFIRPDKGDKAFTGRVWMPEEIDAKLWKISTEEMSPEDLLFIDNPRMIDREWRVVCANKKVITGSRYKTAGMTDYRRELPPDVQLFAERIIQSDWQPDPIYVLDICSTYDRFFGKLFLLEIGAFNVAGLYHSEFDKIVEAVEELVLKEKEEEDGEY